MRADSKSGAAAGFALKAVHLSHRRRSTGEVVALRRHSRRLSDGGHDPAAGRNRRAQEGGWVADDGGGGGLPDLDWSKPSRNRTLSLLKICMESYPSCYEGMGSAPGQSKVIDCGYSAEAMHEIFSNGESLYGANVKDEAAEDAADEAVHQANRVDVMGDAVTDEFSFPADSAEFVVGIEVQEWVRGNQTVLAFRGSYTDMDFVNLENMVLPYLLEKSSAKMKSAWVNDANLTWTDEMRKRSEKRDTPERLIVRTISKYTFEGGRKTVKDKIFGGESFPQTLSGAVEADAELTEALGGGLSTDEAKARGYWQITKLVAEDSLRRLPPGQALTFTGHSQGGTRAQLASMYLAQQRPRRSGDREAVSAATEIPVVTFGSTGASCASRYLFNEGSNLLDDVDPFQEYSYMTEYVHPLDPWGNSMLGEDPGGDVCFVGTAGLQNGEEDPAYKYCSRVYGWNGPTIIMSRGGVTLPWRGLPDQFNEDFSRCRYFTHTLKSLLLGLEAKGALGENGVPDGGCRQIPVVPRDDPNGVCPTGAQPSDEKTMAGGIIAAIVISLLLGFGCCCFCCVWCHRRRMKGKKQTELEAEDDDFVENGDGERANIAAHAACVPFVIRGPGVTVNETDLPLGIRMTGGQKLRDNGLTGEGTKVAVIDSGVDADHPGFDGCVMKQKWYREGTPLSVDDHGTHVAGTIHFMAPDAEIYDYRVFGETPARAEENLSCDDAIAAAIEQAVLDGCHVINMSLRVSDPLVPAVRSAVEHAYSKGVHMICAAGNGGDDDPLTNEMHRSYPARWAETISVAAIKKAGGFPVASFSESNPQVDYAGIGVDVISLKPGGGYQSMRGTSMAAPHVTGLIAALLTTENNLTVEQLREMLDKRHAIDIGIKGPDALTGIGFLTYLDQEELSQLWNEAEESTLYEYDC